jgi:nitrite reductase/ring-hydroxylating ferredoxin subunit
MTNAPMPDAGNAAASEDCTGCTLHDRRTFVMRALTALAAVSALLPGTLSAGELPAAAWLAGRRGSDGTARYPLPAADGATIDAENEVILVRSGGRVYAFALSCPHQRAMLKVKGGDTAFLCPKHKSEYRIDGAYIRGRATRSMDRHGIRREGAEVVVDLDLKIESDDDPSGWSAAFVTI